MDFVTSEKDTIIYRQLIAMMMRAKRHMFIACDSWQLTPVQGMLLVVLEESDSKTMNELSNMMGCDASNITGLIDRLEVGGYIERTADTADRRVKKIKLSKKGCECRCSLLNTLAEAESVDMSQLTDEEIETLKKIFNKLST